MGQQYTDGWLGRIGMVATAPGNAAEADFNRYRPQGVAVMTTRVPLKSSTAAGIRNMNKLVNHAARMLAENAYCDVVLLSSTAGSFVEGVEKDKNNTKYLEDKIGCRVISSAECMIRALKAISVQTVTLITPSSPELCCAECDYLDSVGITVVAKGGFLLENPKDILCVSPKDVMNMVKERDSNDSDAVLISCSGLHVMEIIESLEKELHKPVLASNQFGLWGCLKELGISTHNVPGSLSGY